MTTYSTKNTATTSYQSSTASNVWFCIRESLKRRTNSQHGVVLARFFKCWTRMAQDGWTCQILVFMGVMSLERIVGGWLKHTAGLKDRDAGGITLPYNIIIMNKSPFLVKTLQDLVSCFWHQVACAWKKSVHLMNCCKEKIDECTQFMLATQTLSLGDQEVRYCISMSLGRRGLTFVAKMTEFYAGLLSVVPRVPQVSGCPWSSVIMFFFCCFLR